MRVNGPDGQAYNMPDDATDSEILALFGESAKPPVLDTLPSHIPAFNNQQGSRQNVLGIATPRARAEATQLSKVPKAFIESMPGGAARIADTGAALIGSFAQDPETSLASKVQRNITEPAIKYWEDQKTPEPLPTTAQKVASSLGAMAPAVPLGLPVMVADATYQTGKDFIDQGVSTEQAQKAAIIQGLAGTAMGAIPAATSVKKGLMLAPAMPAIGAGSSLATRTLLSDTNPEVANQFDPLDPAARAVDMLFAGSGLVHGLKGKTVKAEEAPRQSFTPKDTAPDTAPKQESATQPPPPPTPTPPQPESQPGPQYDTGQEPFSSKRLMAEIKLAQDPNTSKSAVEIPATAPIPPIEIVKLAHDTGMKPLKADGRYYLYNTAETTAKTLRDAVTNDTKGTLLGYGTEKTPDTGVDYAVSLDGKGTVDLPTIKQWRDNDNLAFAGRAIDEQMATTKMQEMGAKQLEAPQTESEVMTNGEEKGQRREVLNETSSPVTQDVVKSVPLTGEAFNAENNAQNAQVKTTPTEVVKEAVKVAKQEGTPLKEQKKFLLENIDDAIKTAPAELHPDHIKAKNQFDDYTGALSHAKNAEARELDTLKRWEDETNDSYGSRDRIIREANQKLEAARSDIEKITTNLNAAKQSLVDGGAYVTIHVPDDGTFNVFNSKSALKQFKEQVSKMFPERAEAKPKEGYGNTPKPTGVKAEGISDFVAAKDNDGNDWHTNGQILVKGTPKVKPKTVMVDETKSKAIQDRNPDYVANYTSAKGTSPVVKTDFVAMSDKASDNGAFISKSDAPIKTGKDELGFVRLTSEDGKTADVSQKYYVYIKHHFPKSEVRMTDGKSPVKFVEKGETVAVVMPMNLGENVKARISEVLKETVRPNQPTGGKSSYSDTGGYSDRPTQTRETTQTFLELPEMLKLAKAINEGKTPRLMEKLGKALGRFSHDSKGNADIKLRKDLFAGPKIAEDSMKPAKAREAWEAWQKEVQDANPDADIIFRQKYNRKTGEVEFKAYKRDPNYVLKTFAHEIGHNIDYVPDNMVRGRGNILGHIAALKGYMKHTLEMYPDAKGKSLTPEDRARLAKEAKIDVLANSGVDIVETITREVPTYTDAGVTPDMIRDIWNGMSDARNQNPDLYKFIAKLSDAEKKSVVVQAMRGVVDERLASLGRRQTGTETITETVTRKREVSPEAIRERTRQLIKEEILKRRLYEKSVINDELKALTQIWKPFDPSVNPEYTKYRHSAPELYADATSVLFNEPQLLKDTAPTFYKAFFYYMGERPTFKEAYTALSRLSKDPQALNASRYADEMAMYQAGHEKADQLRKDRPDAEVIYDTVMRYVVDKNHDILKRLPDNKAGINARNQLEEMQYLSGEVENYVKKQHTIAEEIKVSGLTVDDLGAYLNAKNIIANRDSIANTQGKTVVSETAKLKWMRDTMGADKFTALEKAAESFRENRQYIIKRISDSGIVTPELLERITNNDEYVRTDVQKYMDGKYGAGTATGAGWKKLAEGTLEDINNPFIATVLQDMSILRMAKINEVKRSLVQPLADNNQIQKAQLKYNPGTKRQEPVNHDNTKAILTVLKNGKPEYYIVDKHVADVFQFDPSRAKAITGIWGNVTTAIRDVLVSKNPAWMLRNIKRDYNGTIKNNNEISWWNPMDRVKLLKAYKQALPEVYQDVFNGKRSADIEAMHNSYMLNSERMYANKEQSFDDPLTRLAAEFRFGEEPAANKAIQMLKSFYNYLDKLGQISEKSTKVAGYKMLNGTMDTSALGHKVRTSIGTPDVKRQGSGQQLTNNMFLFSNVNKEGIRTAINAYKEDPTAYIMKTTVGNIAPKVLLAAAAYGMFGDDMKKVVDAIPSWAKRTYNVIPLPGIFSEWAKKMGIAGANDVAYLRLPSDYEGQFFGSLVHDAMSEDKIKNMAEDILSQLPYSPDRFHPMLKAAWDMAQYARGESPRDNFRHKDVLTQEQKNALEVKGHLNAKSTEGMAKHLYNTLGMGSLYRLDNKEFPHDQQTQEKVFKQLMRYLGGYVEFTDDGVNEQRIKPVLDKRKEKAFKSYEVGDVINDAIREGKDKPSDVVAVYRQLLMEGKLDPSKVSFGQFRNRYNNTLMQKEYGIKPTSREERKMIAQ